MCGRFTLTTVPDPFAEVFRLENSPRVEPRYNIAPTQEAVVVRSGRGGKNELSSIRWGLVPNWSNGPGEKPLINARCETVDSKPSFSESFERRRCLVPADGYYEWKKTAAGRLPYYLQLQDAGLFAMAGVWDRWVGGDAGAVESFAVITTDSNEVSREIHDRMPAIIPLDRVDHWFSPDTELDDLKRMLVPYPSEKMVVRPVSSRVNNVANDDPSCLEPSDANLDLGL